MARKRGDPRKVSEIYIDFLRPETQSPAGYIFLGGETYTQISLEDIAAALELMAKNIRETLKHPYRLTYVDLDEGKFSAG